ncbi:hypothetical protein HNY73_013739 [Argiope bruennichi]|uniref:Uncharacterized protein n=1 Tax=Argiope bruennichi TaxID=94029 RepID=A0A8T0ELK9_ARGBR|nr:hypothetical protein HNY73_013739 [Argiope bruennichi]
MPHMSGQSRRMILPLAMKGEIERANGGLRIQVPTPCSYRRICSDMEMMPMKIHGNVEGINRGGGRDELLSILIEIRSC